MRLLSFLTQTATGDLEAIHAHMRVAQDSIVVNPAWQALEQQSKSRGYQANQDATRRQHEATMAQIHANTKVMIRGHNAHMAAIRQFGEANTARYNERMAGMDREQRIRVDAIRGESQYVNTTTGERAKSRMVTIACIRASSILIFTSRLTRPSTRANSTGRNCKKSVAGLLIQIDLKLAIWSAVARHRPA